MSSGAEVCGRGVELPLSLKRAIMQKARPWREDSRRTINVAKLEQSACDKEEDGGLSARDELVNIYVLATSAIYLDSDPKRKSILFPS